MQGGCHALGRVQNAGGGPGPTPTRCGTQQHRRVAGRRRRTHGCVCQWPADEGTPHRRMHATSGNGAHVDTQHGVNTLPRTSTHATRREKRIFKRSGAPHQTHTDTKQPDQQAYQQTTRAHLNTRHGGDMSQGSGVTSRRETQRAVRAQLQLCCALAASAAPHAAAATRLFTATAPATPKVNP